MSDVSVTDAAQPAAALGAYAEALLRGRRVGVLGDSTTPLADQLFARGARLVHVYDPDPGRLAVAAAKRAADAGARPQRAVIALFAEDLGVRDGAFDVVLVPDLSAFDDPQEIVRRLRRLVSPSGVVIVASPNPEAKRFLLPPSGAMGDALGYYELYDSISLQFPEVKMLGQAPFVGYSIVDFSESEPDVSVDTSLLDEPEAPEWYIVVASDRRVDLDAYSLIEIPVADVARLGAVADPVTVPRMRPAVVEPRAPSDNEVALTAAQTRISVLLTENETLREQVKDRARADRAAEHASLRASELEREVEAERVRAEALRGEAEALRAAVEAERAQAEAARAEVRRAHSIFEVERHARESTETDLAAARKRVAEVEAQLATVEPPTLRSKEMQQKLIATLEAQKTELAERERGLVNRASELEAEIVKLKSERTELQRRADAARIELERRADAAELRLASVESGLDKERAAAAEQLGVVAPLEQEIHHLETALRERGHEVQRLQRELRDTERVGRELLFDLEDLRSATGGSTPGGSPSGGGGSNGEGSKVPGAARAAEVERRALDLAERAARAEADLLASGWKIARLEREMSRRSGADQADPSAATRELEIALAAAQREIAILRSRASVAPGEEGASIIEDAVLLGQLERERRGDRPSKERP